MTIREDVSLPAGDDATLNFDVTGNPGDTLAGSSIRWRVYDQRFGIPVGDPLIDKSNIDSPDEIEILSDTALTFAVSIAGAETEGLLGRYYHEAEITFSDGTVATVTAGILTVTRGEIVV